MMDVGGKQWLQRLKGMRIDLLFLGDIIHGEGLESSRGRWNIKR